MRKTFKFAVVNLIKVATSFLRRWGRRYLPPALKTSIFRLGFWKSVDNLALLPLPSSKLSDSIIAWKESGRLLSAANKQFRQSGGDPKVSIIILAHNQFQYTRLCLETIYLHTHLDHFEIVLIDNASSDQTREYLTDLSTIVPNLRLIRNNKNEGFSKAVNQGISNSRGKYLVILNNDAIVSDNWLIRMLNHLKNNDNVGMVGPVTNSSGNEQRISAKYDTFSAFQKFAESRYLQFSGLNFEIDMLPMFCVLLEKSVVEIIGKLDQRFGLGYFEDEDYAMRLKEKNYRLICAEDVYVHHFRNVSFKAFDREENRISYEKNKRMFEEKWQVRWRPQNWRDGL